MTANPYFQVFKWLLNFNAVNEASQNHSESRGLPQGRTVRNCLVLGARGLNVCFFGILEAQAFSNSITSMQNTAAHIKAAPNT